MKTLDADVDISDKRLTHMPKKADGTYLFKDVHVIGNFDCSWNNFESLEGCPSSVEGDFFILTADCRFSQTDINERCEVGGIIYLFDANEWAARLSISGFGHWALASQVHKLNDLGNTGEYEIISVFSPIDKFTGDIIEKTKEGFTVFAQSKILGTVNGPSMEAIMYRRKNS